MWSPLSGQVPVQQFLINFMITTHHPSSGQLGGSCQIMYLEPGRELPGQQAAKPGTGQSSSQECESPSRPRQPALTCPPGGSRPESTQPSLTLPQLAARLPLLLSRLSFSPSLPHPSLSLPSNSSPAATPTCPTPAPSTAQAEARLAPERHSQAGCRATPEALISCLSLPQRQHL